MSGILGLGKKKDESEPAKVIETKQEDNKKALRAAKCLGFTIYFPYGCMV